MAVEQNDAERQDVPTVESLKSWCDHLWSEEGAMAVAWLTKKHGLSEDIIKRTKLGLFFDKITVPILIN